MVLARGIFPTSYLLRSCSCVPKDAIPQVYCSTHLCLHGLCSPLQRHEHCKSQTQLLCDAYSTCPLINSNPAAYVSSGWVFQKYLKDEYRGWWMQYSYVTSAALDVSLALCALAIFFFVQLPGGVMPNFWGVAATGESVDVQEIVVKITGENFGPATWTW